MNFFVDAFVSNLRCCAIDDVEQQDVDDNEDVESPCRKCPRADSATNAEEPLPSLQVLVHCNT